MKENALRGVLYDSKVLRSSSCERQLPTIKPRAPRTGVKDWCEPKSGGRPPYFKGKKGLYGGHMGCVVTIHSFR